MNQKAYSKFETQYILTLAAQAHKSIAADIERGATYTKEDPRINDYLKSLESLIDKARYNIAHIQEN